jgi:hypothetical protein
VVGDRRASGGHQGGTVPTVGAVAAWRAAVGATTRSAWCARSDGDLAGLGTCAWACCVACWRCPSGDTTQLAREVLGCSRVSLAWVRSELTRVVEDSPGGLGGPI